MKRYRCPLCAAARNAPSRMAPNDARRFCLPCTDSTGKLVEMRCPSRERSKEKARKSRLNRAAKTREKDRQSKFYLDDGTDIRPIVKSVKKLATWHREGAPAGRAVRAMETELTDAGRAYPWDEFVADLFYRCAVTALRGVHLKLTKSNVDSLISDAAFRFFALDSGELLRVARMEARLLGSHDLDYLKAVVTCARARGAEPPLP